MIARRAPRRFRRGFTLIEAIATIVILGAIGSMTSMMIANSVAGYAAATTSAQLHTEASVAMDRIVRALRNIELDSGAGGVAPDITNVTSASIAWNPSSSLSLSGDQITLEEDGGGAIPILYDVTAFSIATYDEDNALLNSSLSGAACDPIRRIELQLSVQRQGESESLRTKLFLRATMTGSSS